MGACKSPRDDGKVGVPWFRAKDSTLASFELAGYLLNVTASLVRTSGQSCRCFDLSRASLSRAFSNEKVEKVHPQKLFSAGQAEQQPVEQRIAALPLSGLP
jgi:hypothetical protein